MKRIGILLALMLAFCTAAAAQPLQVVATIFPICDWTREIIGETEGVELTMLMGGGVDLHSFQPSAQDIMKVSSCDVFIDIGGVSDEWAKDALATAVNGQQRVLHLLDALGDSAKLEEHVEGMEEDGEEDEEYDEHVWLSLRNAETLCRKIAETLGEADPAHAEAYSANCGAYVEKLKALDTEYCREVENAKHHTLLFGDRFPFRYLTDDYELSYYAAFSGCSAETEASFRTVIFLAGKLDELGLPAVLKIDGSDGRIAETVARSAKAQDARILTLDSMQSVTDEEIAGGTTYLSLMEENLKTLHAALN